MKFDLRFGTDFTGHFLQFTDDFLREKITEQFLVSHLVSGLL